MSILYDIAYIVVACFVTVLLLALVIFPFWKVWARMKTHHKDLWDARGPFEWSDFRANPALVKEFLVIVALADRDEILRGRDKTFIRWTQAAREIHKLFPVGLKEQLIYFILFICFVLLLTHAVMGALF